MTSQISLWFKYPSALTKGAVATLVATLFLAVPVAEARQGGETLQLDFGAFSIHGSYAKRACSAQANLKSKNGEKVGFALYWRIGKDLYLLVSHPGNAALKGKQKIRFAFDAGQKVTFPMRGNGAQLQVPIGIGPRGSAFYNAVQANDAVTIEMPGVGDSVRVDFGRRDEVQGGMQSCSDWMHG